MGDLLSITLQKANGCVNTIILIVFATRFAVCFCVALLLSYVGVPDIRGRRLVLSHWFLSFFLGRGVIINTLVLWHWVDEHVASLFTLSSQSPSVHQWNLPIFLVIIAGLYSLDILWDLLRCVHIPEIKRLNWNVLLVAAWRIQARVHIVTRVV